MLHLSQNMIMLKLKIKASHVKMLSVYPQYSTTFCVGRGRFVSMHSIATAINQLFSIMKISVLYFPYSSSRVFKRDAVEFNK